jgi:tRNA (guanine-N7-)-methyltransferase
MTSNLPAAEPRLTHQSIRSFVLRQGRMSPAQMNAYETLMPRYGITYVEPVVESAAGNRAVPPAPLNFAAIFGRSAPTILEIGSGMGETTAAIAEAMPEKNFIAVEVHTPGVGALLKLIEQKELANLRVIQHDAVEVVQQMIGENTLAGIHLFFADPWPKARHHKRRIVQPPFVKLLATRLAPAGYLHCATDWEPYAQHMLEVLSSERALNNSARPAHPDNHSASNISIAAGFVPRPPYRPITKFETRGLKLGHGVWDLVFTKPSSKGTA